MPRRLCTTRAEVAGGDGRCVRGSTRLGGKECPHVAPEPHLFTPSLHHRILLSTSLGEITPRFALVWPLVRCAAHDSLTAALVALLATAPVVPNTTQELLSNCMLDGESPKRSVMRLFPAALLLTPAITLCISALTVLF